MAKMAWIADEMSRQPAGTVWMVDKFGDVSFHPPVDMSAPDEPEVDEEDVACDICRSSRCRCDDDYQAWKDEQMMIEDGR